jgi:hypothetical protein
VQGWGWVRGASEAAVDDGEEAGIDAQAQPRTPVEELIPNPRSIVEVDIERPSRSVRQVNAAVQIWAPADVVYDILTDYDNLASFIPGYVKLDPLTPQVLSLTHKQVQGWRENHWAMNMICTAD